MRVLIVDDAEHEREKMNDIMETLGHEVVHISEDGQDAVNAYMKYTPDLVTMDVNMPKMSGLVALSSIIKTHASAKVLMVTTNGVEHCVVRAINEGALGYILKPATEDGVKESIKKIFSKDVSYDEDDIYDEGDFFHDI